MTKDQLIQSFNDSNLTIQSYLYSWYFWVTVALGVSLVIYFIIRDIKDKEFQIDFVEPIVYIKYAGTVILTLAIAGFILVLDNEDRHTNEWSLMYPSSEWRMENFYGKYLKDQPKEKIDVGDYKINSNGTVTVMLDTDKPKTVLTNITDVDYVDSDHGYIEAVWVDDLEDYSITTNFYETKLFLPKEWKK